MVESNFAFRFKGAVFTYDNNEILFLVPPTLLATDNENTPFVIVLDDLSSFTSEGTSVFCLKHRIS